MSTLLNNPAHWHLRAQESRLLACEITDPVAKATILRIADDDDGLAARAVLTDAKGKPAQGILGRA
jgi:hypothetical protein